MNTLQILLIIPFIFLGWLYLVLVNVTYTKIVKKETVLTALGCVLAELLAAIPLCYIGHLIYNQGNFKRRLETVQQHPEQYGSIRENYITYFWMEYHIIGPGHERYSRTIKVNTLQLWQINYLFG